MDKEVKSKIKVFKYIRPIIYGVSLYLLITNLPLLILKSQGIKLAQPNNQIEEEPIYKDKNGKRINKLDYDKIQGYEYASKERFFSHAECKEKYFENKDLFLRSGCDKYITEKNVISKHIPHVKQGNWNSGKTTAQCIEEVDAYWRPQVKDAEELGDSSGFRDYGDERLACQNYDNVRITQVVFEPTNRLAVIIKKLEHGEKISSEEHDKVIKDMELVKTYPENQYTIQYFNMVDRFFILAARTQK
jgi:hypothetical protein